MKSNPAIPGVSITSKPTWGNTSGCFPTSAFFELYSGFMSVRVVHVLLQANSSWLIGCTFRTPLDENEIEAFVKEVVPSNLYREVEP